MQHTSHSEIHYLTTPDLADPSNLKVNTIGFESIPDHSAYPAAGHPQGYSFNFERGRELQEFQLVYITKGRGKFASKHQAICEVLEGSMLVIFPGEWHTYKPDETTGWETYWIGFSGPFANNLLTGNFLFLKNPVINIGYDEEMVGLYKKILDASKGERPGFQQLLSGIVVHLLAYLFYREKDNNWKDKEVRSKIDKARLMIREKLNNNISPEELAASLNMSYTWFRRMFKQYTGLAPAQYISQLKMQKAKELLSVTSLSVKEIAIELGFESIDYFSTSFKKHIKMTPGEFRSLGRGKRN